MTDNFRRFLLIVLCTVLGFGAPVSASFAAKSDAPCAMTMDAGSDDGAAVSDCCGDLPAMSLCAQVCGFASGSLALAFDTQLAAPDFVSVLILAAPDSTFASRAGPPPLKPPL